MQKNHISWFEILVKDMERACKFYSEVFGVKIVQDSVAGPEFEMGVFEHSEDSVSGALIKGKGYEPSDKGPVIYMNAEPSIESCLSKVEKSGGKIAVPKFRLSEQIGYIAFFYDTEGNKLAMHSLS